VLIRTILARTDLRLAWVASRNPATRSLVPPETIVAEDWRTFQEVDIEGVVIASPPALHASMLRLAINNAIPAFVEKPLTTRLDDARELADLAQRKQALVLIDHTHLFQHGYATLRNLVGEEGGLLAVRSEGGQPSHPREDVAVLWDYGPHDVAMCLDLLGRGASVVSAAHVSVRRTPRGLGEDVRIALGWPGGEWAECVVGNLMPRKVRRFVAASELAVYVFDDLAETPLVRFPPLSCAGWPDGTGGGTPVPVSRELPLERAMARFAAGIRGDLTGHPEFGLALGVDVVRVLAEADAFLGK
jgi:predicted dehydrogenase